MRVEGYQHLALIMAYWMRKLWVVGPTKLRGNVSIYVFNIMHTPTLTPINFRFCFLDSNIVPSLRNVLAHILSEILKWLMYKCAAKSLQEHLV